MTRIGLVAHVALAELWFSFELLALIALLVGAGIAATFISALPAVELAPGGVYALALALAISLAAALVARSFAVERRRGRLGWLAVRAVPRASILFGWLVALVGILAVGLIPSGILGWLTVSPEAVGPGDGPGFGAAMLAAGSVALAAFCLAAVLGLLLDPLPAMAVTLASCAAVAALGFVVGPPPLAGFTVLAGLPEASFPVARSLRGAGEALAVSSVLAVVALAVLQRVDL
ncbi:MAG: hypothetical protein M3Y88_08940 [Chloroflexota bacterium]|nr:hypothetical protein [Chloroflexota bacterium]